MALENVLYDPFKIPAHWPRCYALDPGWRMTAALWAALDRESDCWYLYAEHYRGESEPSTHATAIKARGDWIPGLIDPSSDNRAQKDGTRLMLEYNDLGLNLVKTDNAVEAGIHAVWLRLETGRLKFSRALQNLQAEYRLYRRDEKGKVVKENDHLCDCMRYIVLSGKAVATVKPANLERGLGSAAGGDRTVGY